MTPQSDFMVTAPIVPEREEALRALLAGMNSAPGVADPHNAVLPFGDFERLHFARLLVLDDFTVGDLEVYDLPPPRVPRYLALMGNCDGPARELLAELALRCAGGLRRLFSHCEGFEGGGTDLAAWLLAHDVPAAASYVNWRGRTVRQVREESALRRALAGELARLSGGWAGLAATAGGDEAGDGRTGGAGSHDRNSSGSESGNGNNGDGSNDGSSRPGSPDVQSLRRALVDFARDGVRAGRLALTPPAPTPLGWQVANFAHAVGGALLALVAAPFALVLLPFFLLRLRRLETTDPELAVRPPPQHLRRLQQLEDREAVNQYSAIGEVKPGRFRHALVVVLLAAIDYACRHVYTRGYLARIQTIHFARWSLIDGGRRVVFASSYDGLHESYMDDFIGKAAWGLNLAFSNGVGYPSTDWLLKRGARREQRFKYFQRRHQLPTEVWYHACPGLTAVDLERNRRIREGLERPSVSDAEALAWLRLL